MHLNFGIVLVLCDCLRVSHALRHRGQYPWVLLHLLDQLHCLWVAHHLLCNPHIMSAPPPPPPPMPHRPHNVFHVHPSHPSPSITSTHPLEHIRNPPNPPTTRRGRRRRRLKQCVKMYWRITESSSAPRAKVCARAESQYLIKVFSVVLDSLRSPPSFLSKMVPFSKLSLTGTGINGKFVRVVPLRNQGLQILPVVEPRSRIVKLLPRISILLLCWQ